MDWGARLRAAWRGEVSNADLGAMFTATARLSDLQQALGDRRLAADIEHSGNDWRALLAVGPIAAPLWLADALVALAGALYDAEGPEHGDRPASISAYTHEVVAELLSPIEDIIADVTAAVADPGHRTALTAPLHVGPGGGIASERLPYLPPIPYSRGLATGARRVHTSAAAALAAAQATVAKSPAPDWLTSGLRRLDGELQAAGARLEVAELRLTPLLGERGGDPSSLAAVCRDLWMVVDTAVVAGQVIADPHLLPEARVIPQHAATPPSPSRATSPVLPPMPPMPRRMRAVALPEIAEGMPAPQDEPKGAPGPARFSTPSPPANVSLPSIGGDDVDTAPPPAAAGDGGAAPDLVSLPSIGDVAQPPATHPTPPIAPPQAPHPTPPHANETEPDDEPPIRLPDIG